jgi:hypothetical protein
LDEVHISGELEEGFYGDRSFGSVGVLFVEYIRPIIYKARCGNAAGSQVKVWQVKRLSFTFVGVFRDEHAAIHPFLKGSHALYRQRYPFLFELLLRILVRRDGYGAEFVPVAPIFDYQLALIGRFFPEARLRGDGDFDAVLNGIRMNLQRIGIHGYDCAFELRTVGQHTHREEHCEKAPS